MALPEIIKSIDSHTLSSLLKMDVADKVYDSLPGETYNGPIMLLPGHLENSDGQLYMSSHINTKGVWVGSNVDFYIWQIGEEAKINIRKGKTLAYGFVHIGNAVSEPVRQLAIPTVEFLTYLQEHAL